MFVKDMQRGNHARSRVEPTREPRTVSGLLLKGQEVVRRQGRSVRTLQNQRMLGGTPLLKLGRSIRYRLGEVVALEAQRVLSTSEGGQHD